MRSRHLIWTLAAAAGALASTGCNQLLGIKDLSGGGGDGGDIDSGIPDAHIAAFIVTETTPAANAPAGDVEMPLIVKFSHVVAPATVTTTTFTLVHRPDDKPISITPSATGGNVTLTLAAPLDFLEPYRLTISADVMDDQSTRLGTDVVVDFTARDGVWTILPPIAAQIAGDSVEGVSIAAGPTAPFWIGFTEKGSQRTAYVAHLSITGALDTPAMLATNSGLDGFSLGVPQLVVGGAGHALATWSQINGGLSSQVNASSYDGAGWNAPMTLSSANMGSPAGPVPGIDRDGTTYVAFPGVGDSPGPASTRVRSAAGTWAAGQVFAQGAYPVAMWGSATAPGAVMLYLDASGLEAANYNPNDGLFHGISTYYPITSGTSIPCAIAAISPDNMVPVFLFQNASGNTARAGQLGPAFSPTDPSIGCPDGALDGNGNVMVVWPAGSGADTSVHARRQVNNVGLGADTRLDDPVKGASSMPHVVVDGAGRNLAIWAQTDGVHPALRSRRFLPDSGWSTSIADVQVGTAPVDAAQLVVEPSGRALALISRGNVSTLALYH